jgi:hypothetical protein
MLQRLSIESILNKRYSHVKKDMTPDRSIKYLTYLMATKLKVDILEGQKWGVYTGDVADELKRVGLDNFIPLLGKSLDDCSVQTFYLFNHWLNGTLGKNYVPSKSLLDVLSKIDVDMKASYLKEKVRGYFELSHANIKPPAHWSPNTINSVMFEINSDSLILSFQFNSDLAPTSFFVPLNREDNLHDALLNFNFKEIARIKTEIGYSEKPIGEDDIEVIRLIFNLIIYVTNPNEEFISCLNKFSPNNKIAQIEKLDYTQRPFIRLGFDAEFVRLITTESFDVRSHWRWQPCGVGRQQRRLTFVKAHQRNITKIQGDGNGISI